MVINEGHKPLFSRRVSDLGRSPNITVDNSERLVGLYGCEGNETRYCLAQIHTSHNKVETSTLEKKMSKEVFHILKIWVA